jgi:membrane-associated phospholipid phosphatase
VTTTQGALRPSPNERHELCRPTVGRSGVLTPLIGTLKKRIIIGIVLLVGVAVGGAYFAYRPGPTPLDSLAFRILPSEYTHHYLTYFADLGRPRAVIPGVIISSFIAFFWDRRRALSCLLAPLVAICITEYLAKPAVGRTFGGTLCYPSGHMTAVTALVCAFVIAVPPRWRMLAAVAGLLVCLGVGPALILLRWHFLTDVIAGASVSIASTLIIDSLLHYPRSFPSLPFSSQVRKRSAPMSGNSTP